MPDLTVLLMLLPEQAAARLALRDTDGTDRIGGRERAYHARVTEAFARFAQEEPARFAVVPADGSPDEVQRCVIAAVSRLDAT